MQNNNISNRENMSNTDQQKITRLVEYLLRLANLRTKVIYDVKNYERILWLSDIPHAQGCFTQAWGNDEEHELDEWIEVQNMREPELPAIPTQCKDWVNEAILRNKNDIPKLFDEITIQTSNTSIHEKLKQPETIPYKERIKDHPEIQQAWEKYIENKWLPWSEEHNEWEKIHEVYSNLFSFYQEQLRLGEEYELVLGLGLLIWKTPTGQLVRRHLIVADAILEFEASLGKFTIRPHTEGAKLRIELDMLDINDQPVQIEETAKSSLAAAQDNPWAKECIQDVLRMLVHSIDPQGKYDDFIEAKTTNASEKPIVKYAPALILRKRSTN